MFKIIHNRIGTDIWANTRLKLIKKMVKNGKVLDLGCGPGYIGQQLESKAEVYYLDSNPDELKKFKSSRKFIGNAEKTPFENDFFDYVVCGDVLEHLDNDGVVIKEIYRILKNNGKVIITVPAYKKLYGHHDRLIGHRRRYDKRDLKRILINNNFEVKKLGYTCSLLFIPFLLNQCLLKKKSAYHGKSRIERKFLPILDFISEIESRIKLPFGLGLLVLAEKLSFS